MLVMMMMNHYFLAPKLFPLFLSSLWHKSPCKNLQVETQWVGHSVAQILLYEIEFFLTF